MKNEDVNLDYFNESAGKGLHVSRASSSVTSVPRKEARELLSNESLLLLAFMQRWAKWWTCFAKQWPGKAGQKFLAT